MRLRPVVVLTALVLAGCAGAYPEADASGSPQVHVVVVRALDEVDVPPRLLTQPAADLYYPQMERRAGVEGIVGVEGVVNVDGTASDLQITQGVSPGIDRDALEFLHATRFEPAVRGGQPVPARVVIEVAFRL